jgi:hypothetical protein
MSTGCRFYLLESDHIVAVLNCECITDAAAVLEADAVLQASTHHAVEVWAGSRRVSLLSRPARPKSGEIGSNEEPS